MCVVAALATTATAIATLAVPSLLILLRRLITTTITTTTTLPPQALRLDGGSKRARLESKVKAAKESAGKGADSLGVAESTVMARWVSDNEDEGDEE